MSWSHISNINLPFEVKAFNKKLLQGAHKLFKFEVFMEPGHIVNMTLCLPAALLKMLFEFGRIR
jgi:hypothetical protein